MSLLRTSRLAGGMSKASFISGVAGLVGKGLWGGAKAVGSSVKSFGVFPTIGMVAGPAAAGAALNEGMKGSKEDMSAEGFSRRMGYGG